MNNFHILQQELVKQFNISILIYIKNENFRAHKDDGSGSAYLQAFSTYLDRHYMNHDLDTIYSMVNRYMASVEHVSHSSFALLFRLLFRWHCVCIKISE